ncbi:MAG: CaiB/BaiF CoA-transferase family protein [Tissierellales bacterium]
MKVLEIESIGPGPFAAMILADLGANVLKISRPGPASTPNPVLNRNRAGTLALDLKNQEDRNKLKHLIGGSDVMLEGFRPEVMERLGFSPEECQTLNPKLIYGRMTGWGRSGPLAHSAGHDINYISLTGALHSMGTAESGPLPPLNLAGDYGGGGLMLALGIVTALFERTRSGLGQVVDTAMIDGAALLMSALYGLRNTPRWPALRAGNLLDSSHYFYRCYQCADGEWVAVGAIELPFRRIMLELLGLKDEIDEILSRPDTDPATHKQLEDIFKQHPRAHWAELFFGTDACVSPVLSMAEVMDHPHNQQSQTFRDIAGVVQPMPAPRFSRTELDVPNPAYNKALLDEWGLDSNL